MLTKNAATWSASKLIHEHSLAVLIRPVNLGHVLCQVDANCRNLHGGRPFRFKWLMTLPLLLQGLPTPSPGGGVHPITYVALSLTHCDQRTAGLSPASMRPCCAPMNKPPGGGLFGT